MLEPKVRTYVRTKKILKPQNPEKISRAKDSAKKKKKILKPENFKKCGKISTEKKSRTQNSLKKSSRAKNSTKKTEALKSQKIREISTRKNPRSQNPSKKFLHPKIRPSPCPMFHHVPRDTPECPCHENAASFSPIIIISTLAKFTRALASPVTLSQLLSFAF